jgi:branched-chain amino acid transport system permease protein
MLASAIASGLVLGCIYGLVAAGLNLIFGVIKIINFAQGALLMVGVYLVYWLALGTGLDPYLTLPLVVVAMAGIGYLVQVGLINRVLGQERTSQLLITFGLAMALENGALLFFGPNHRSVETFLGDGALAILGVRISHVALVAVAGSVITVVALYIFLNKTRLGTAVRSVAQQPESAELSGINVKGAYAIAFAIGTSIVGVAAVLIAPIYDVQPKVGTVFGVMAFIVVILGGLGNVFGAAVAGLLLGLAQNIFATMVNVGLSTAFVLVLFIAIMLVRPSGLFSRKVRVS